MYSGKHAAKDHQIKISKPNQPKKRGYLRVLLLWSLMIFILVGAGSYLYARFLEERIHGNVEVGNAIAGSEDETTKYLDQRDSNQPVTFLLLGSDTRGQEGDPGRADTIMVLRMNPEKKIAYLVSIPRDTWVDIEGHGKRKINAAYQYGGPGLMIKTVRNFTGLDINHYAVVDFQGFKEIVDALGGIDIDVEKNLRDRRLQMDLRAGYQHLDGEEALKYVRIRHCDDDFGRIGSQQKFLKPVMDKLLRLSSVFRIPQLAEIASRNIRTDSGLGISEMIRYGQMMKTIGRSNLHMMTVPATPAMKGAASVVVPDEEKVAWMFERIRNDMPLELTEEEKMNQDIKIDVQNGSGKPGVARKMADKLAAYNFKIKEITNAENFNYYETQIITTPDKEEYARKVQTLIGFGRVIIEDAPQESLQANPDSADLHVIVGRDFIE